MKGFHLGPRATLCLLLRLAGGLDRPPPMSGSLAKIKEPGDIIIVWSIPPPHSIQISSPLNYVTYSGSAYQKHTCLPTKHKASWLSLGQPGSSRPVALEFWEPTSYWGSLQLSFLCFTCSATIIWTHRGYWAFELAGFIHLCFLVLCLRTKCGRYWLFSPTPANVLSLPLPEYQGKPHIAWWQEQGPSKEPQESGVPSLEGQATAVTPNKVRANQKTPGWKSASHTKGWLPYDPL